MLSNLPVFIVHNIVTPQLCMTYKRICHKLSIRQCNENNLL